MVISGVKIRVIFIISKKNAIMIKHKIITARKKKNLKTFSSIPEMFKV
jgi:hypothetical protein